MSNHDCCTQSDLRNFITPNLINNLYSPNMVYTNTPPNPNPTDKATAKNACDSNEMPCLNSVYLEQGGYFLDDEFAIPLDPNLNDDMSDSVKYSLMTQSMNLTHSDDNPPPPSIVDQSHSDSCLFNDQAIKNPTVSNSSGNHINQASYCSHSNGSWMQMIMDQSFNPELRALINRTAAAVDYKIAYSDTLAAQRQLDERFLKLIQPQLPMNGSMSPGSLWRSSMTESKAPSEKLDNTTTTWAKKHGSRESLKRRVRPGQTNLIQNEQVPVDDTSEQSEPLVTWNHFKRTTKQTESLNVHQSRRDQTANSPGDDVVQNRLSTRSHSQPLTTANYRCSGTLLEIFMRARNANVAPDLMTSKIHSEMTNPNQVHTEMSSLFQSRDDTDDLIRSMHNFGAQFPPLDDQSLNKLVPTWSNKSPSRNPTVALLQYYQAVRRSHPVPLYSTRPQSVLNQGNKSNHRSSQNIQPGHLAACLTASAGPDSPYMTALRARCAAQGYAVGWIGNPRTIAYPGLGLLSVPRPSRMTGQAFLSHTLPDLSFLGQAGAEEERKGTPTMTKQQAMCLCANRRFKRTARVCKQCGCRMVQQQQPLKSNLKASTQCACLEDCCQNRHHHHCHQRQLPDGCGRKELKFVNGRKLNLIPAVNKRDYSAAVATTSASDVNSRQINPILCSSMDSTHMPWVLAHPNSNATESSGVGKTNKSLSFCGDLSSIQSETYDVHQQHYSPSQPSPVPKVIPRNWGLYGQEQPLAEFNPRSSSNGRHNDSTKSGHSDVDVRYHAMVNDVIKAVQDTVAFYCHSFNNENIKPTDANDSMPYSKFETTSAVGTQHLLGVVAPLTVLLCDGLLPPARPIFSSKPRTKLWQMVEESCRPGALPAGVAYHVLNDAINQVKSITNITLEKTKFKAFVCACLNAKALPMWLNSVVANDTLLKRFYCDDAFVRQCRSIRRGLYADLTTHLEQLLLFPFNLDISVEARKTAGSSQDGPVPINKAASTNNRPSNNINQSSPKLFKKQQRPQSPTKSNAHRLATFPTPPATNISRKQLIAPPSSIATPCTTLSSTTTTTATTSLPSSFNNNSNSRIPSVTLLPGPRLNPVSLNRPSNTRIPSKPLGPLMSTHAHPDVLHEAPPIRGRFKSALSNLKRQTPSSNRQEGTGSSTSSSSTSTGLNPPNYAHSKHVVGNKSSSNFKVIPKPKPPSGLKLKSDHPS